MESITYAGLRANAAFSVLDAYAEAGTGEGPFYLATFEIDPTAGRHESYRNPITLLVDADGIVVGFLLTE